MLSNLALYSWPEWRMRSQSWRVTMTFRSTMCEHYSITVSYIENRQRSMSNCMPTLFSKHFRHGEPWQQQHSIHLSLQIQTDRVTVDLWSYSQRTQDSSKWLNPMLASHVLFSFALHKKSPSSSCSAIQSTGQILTLIFIWYIKWEKGFLKCDSHAS